MNKKILYITPHLSTGGAPQYLLKKIQLLKNHYNIFVVEFNDYGIYRVQKNQIIDLLTNGLITLGEDKSEILNHIEKIDPDIIHFEEMPELFNIDDEITKKIYVSDRKYKIFETSHDSSLHYNQKRFIPDKFLFCSDNQIMNFRNLNVPACVIEYPVLDHERGNREEGLKALNLDPTYKHVLNVGLFTPRKNQAEIFEYAKKLEKHKIQFHFLENQAPNFKDYWEPLMNDKPENCIIWGERNDSEKFYSCMDLFLFTSKGNSSDKETNPLVIKEALSWKIPTLIHWIDSYQDKYEKRVEYLTNDIDINKIKILKKLNLDSEDINISISDETKVNIYYSDEFFEKNKNKLICIYDSKFDLCIQRSSVLAPGMFIQTFASKNVLNGITVKIFDVPNDYFSSLDVGEGKINDHNLIYQKSFDFNNIDFSIKNITFKPHGIKDDPSAWFTFYEVFLQEVYKDVNITEDDIVLDVGGHFGFFSLYAINKGAKKVHVFEPSMDNYKILCQNTGNFKDIIKHNFAISDNNGQDEFIVTGPSATNSFHSNYNHSEENHVSMGKTKKEKVNMMTLDTFLKNNNLSRVDVLKMDCEGSEWDILPKISDDFFKYKLRKLTIELHQFNNSGSLEDHYKRCKEFEERIISLGYHVNRDHLESDKIDQDGLGSLTATRYPKIKIVHMLCDINGEREKQSIKHLHNLRDFTNWTYEQSINQRYHDIPPKENCARPDDVQLEPGDYKLTGPHYGNFLAHKRVFEEHMNDDYDAVLICESDAIFIKSPQKVFKTIIDMYDEMMYNNLNYMSFGKRIPDWPYKEFEHFGIATRMSEAHCYLVPYKQKDYYLNKFNSLKWDALDLWYNNNIFNDNKSGIVKNPISIQCSGESYLDKIHKDGTTLLKEGDIEYELQ